jgi:peptide/nickel transport system substrate-binding protein
MLDRRTTPWRLVVAALGLALLAGAAACSGPQDDDAGGDGAPGEGGTLTVLNTEPQENFDPARLYTSGGGNVPSLVFRTLTTRNRADGAAGTKAVPDLATDLGRASENATVWTYTLKNGLKYEDGSPITSAGIKYGVERSFAAELMGAPGPSYGRC